MGKVIRVLVVDDSPVARELLVQILSADPELQIAGVATDGEEALSAIARYAPDVVTMDIQMPRLDGLEATRRIMATQPVPIVIVSTDITPEDIATTFHAAEAGALAAVEKPRGPGDLQHDAMARRLVQTVKLMSEIKVVRRWRAGEKRVVEPSQPAPLENDGPQIVAIGASTGGPPVLQTILGALDENFPVPIVIVQHIAPGFLQGMVEWLIQTTGFRVRIALNHEMLKPGHAYFAPDGLHLGVRRFGGTGRVVLEEAPPEHNLRPAASFLFRSVAKAYDAQAVGVLLTGMGRDGAAELKEMREAGAYTIAQDKESSVVHGMPGEAIALGAARCVLPPPRIAETLMKVVK
jgi:two-component system, chemotaxis family, protein-glutamate methylesterase/glutaminase